MKILAISGSARRLSTNTALLRALQSIAPADMAMEIFDGIGGLPVFSPDLEGPDAPESVRLFLQKIAECDGIMISSPEYVRTLPGGLKNAIDWLVSGNQVIGKPIALAHASHRGDDMLQTLRTVLSTISANFNPGIFLRFPLMKEMPETVMDIVKTEPSRTIADHFLLDFAAFCRDNLPDKPSSMVF